MDEKKNPHIPAWKVWILIITTIQAVSAVQNYMIHQQLWDKMSEMCKPMETSTNSKAYNLSERGWW